MQSYENITEGILVVLRPVTSNTAALWLIRIDGGLLCVLSHSATLNNISVSPRFLGAKPGTEATLLVVCALASLYVCHNCIFWHCAV